jgi:hypothetical protein
VRGLLRWLYLSDGSEQKDIVALGELAPQNIGDRAERVVWAMNTSRQNMHQYRCDEPSREKD